jgi:NAD(P)-dependent dehydrogenase (short-subunit alcohol dehydrogenase family)
VVEFDNRVAVVTGAERGLGRAIARQLAMRNLIVLPTARDIALSQIAVEEIIAEGGRAFAYQLDVIEQGSVDRFAVRLADELGRADVLVNNAGVLLDTTDLPSQADLDIVQLTLDTNLFGAWRLCSALLPMMQRQNYGRIVNISSTMGQLETMGHTSPAYRISKTALNALTCMVSAEVVGQNILVNSVEPGWTRTDIGGPDAPQSPEEAADTAVWLATLVDGAANGCFFFNRRLIPW